MHTSSLSAAMHIVLFAGFAAATGGTISLSNFTPRIDNLPAQCKTVYDTKIDACVSSDFNLGATCSSGCLSGLAKIGAAVKTGCAGVDVGETSIIGVFQNDIGIAALCPNNRQTSTSSSPSSTARTTLQSSTRTSTPATTTIAPSTSTTQASSASLLPSSSGLTLDNTATLAIPTGSAAPTSETAPSTPPTGNSQLSNSDSGGGSPFDVVATGAARQLHITYAALSSILVAVVFVVAV